MGKPCAWDARPLYDRLIDPLRETAGRLGYAIAVHGTLKRDIDLVAVPWTSAAVPANELALALWFVVKDVMGFEKLSLMQKAVWRNSRAKTATPHGRAWAAYHLTEDCHGPYIDMSIMPRIKQ